ELLAGAFDGELLGRAALGAAVEPQVERLLRALALLLHNPQALGPELGLARVLAAVVARVLRDLARALVTLSRQLLRERRAHLRLERALLLPLDGDGEGLGRLLEGARNAL